MAPQHEAFVGAINENIKKFEDKHGEISKCQIKVKVFLRLELSLQKMFYQTKINFLIYYPLLFF